MIGLPHDLDRAKTGGPCGLSILPTAEAPDERARAMPENNAGPVVVVTRQSGNENLA